MPQCSVPNCRNVGGHKFPDDSKLRKQWVSAIKRSECSVQGRRRRRQQWRWNWKPGRRACVCRAHFKESDFNSVTFDGNMSQRHILKKGVVPSVFTCHSSCYKHPSPSRPSARERRTEKRVAAREKRRKEMELERERAFDNVGVEEEVVATVIEEAEDTLVPVIEPCRKFTEVGIQVGQREKFTAVNLSLDRMLHFYTGLETYDKFKMVLSSLGQAVHYLAYYHGGPPPLSLEDQLLMTLVKLRRHTPHQELAFLFNIDEKQVSNTFITWINFMNSQWKEIDFWPVKELVQYYCPSDFKSKFPKTRVILDGVECPIQKPGSAFAQQGTFSTYKNRNTVKTVVGGCPGGLVSYVSPAYGGSTSDRQVIERSDIPKMCDPGDQVMVDKGFNIDDLLIPYHVEVNIPSYFKKKNRMSCKSVAKDRTIASKRVHIERLIGLGKTYRILIEPMTPIESSLATLIIKVVFTLCNFRTCIVPPDA